MPKVLVIAQVLDPVKWEKSFTTHGELFRSYSVSKPVQYGLSGNEAAVCFEADNLETFKKSMESKSTLEAMERDGVKRETVKVHVLDREMKI